VVTNFSQADVDVLLERFGKAAWEYSRMVDRQKYILATLVRELRTYGASWRDIGRAAGISHVAAMNRWKADPVLPAADVAYYGDPEDLDVLHGSF
jgi:hypothetical protein